MLIKARRHLVSASLVAVAYAILTAQDPPPHTTYTYEVVSIHRAAPGEMNSGFSDGPHGGMRARNVTTLEALAFAYAVQDYQFVEVPSWARSERFEITFTPDRSEIDLERGTKPEALDGWFTRQRQRMQAVLRDRFSLVLHRETRELPLYELRVARNGHKLSAPAHPERSQTLNINGGRQVIATTAAMKSFAESLSLILGRPVHDETGLEGAFDFRWIGRLILLCRSPD
jgi:uncharacterized protein (TIGR03435 family)